jgi:hypothetical protein
VAEPLAGESNQQIALIVTDRTVQRDWPVSAAYRPSGDVPAGPVYWPSVVNYHETDDVMSALKQPIDFFFNTLLVPVRAVLTPPCTKIIYSEVGPPGKEHVDFGQPSEPAPTTRPVD